MHLRDLKWQPATAPSDALSRWMAERRLHRPSRDIAVARLPFHPEVFLVRLRGQGPSEPDLFVIDNALDILWLDGSAAAIVELNQRHIARINRFSVLPYLEFLCHFLKTDTGFSRFVLGPEDSGLPEHVLDQVVTLDTLTAPVRCFLRPPAVLATTAVGAVICAGALHEAGLILDVEFTVDRQGGLQAITHGIIASVETLPCDQAARAEALA